MNLLLFRPGEVDADGIGVVTGEPLRHLREVLDLGVGDTMRVGELGGLSGDGVIEHIDAGEARLRCHLHTPPPAKMELTVILALPRPKMLRRVLRAVAEFGVPQLYLINSYRVEKSYWQTPVLAQQMMEAYLVEGLAQARDTVLPQVTLRKRFKPFVEDEVPGLLQGKQALVAQPGELPPCPRGPSPATVIAIGPEGGWIPFEVEKLEAAGCQPVSLGPRILRVEDALVSLLGRLA
ncbi:MAG: 16S rRNA (uracil(1498)-N(3))-methyltransferase [Pseudomonadota bacterium]